MRDIALARSTVKMRHIDFWRHVRALGIDQTRVKISDGWDSYAQCLEFKPRIIDLGWDTLS